jgi:hypothetical protein
VIETSNRNLAIGRRAGTRFADVPISNDFRRRRSAVSGSARVRTLSAVVVLVLGIAPMTVLRSAAWADPPADSPSAHTERNRKLREQQFLREHSDASGKPRPDLWRAGVEQQKNMKVAPYIGWHPSTGQPGKSDTGSTIGTH